MENDTPVSFTRMSESPNSPRSPLHEDREEPRISSNNASNASPSSAVAGGNDNGAAPSSGNGGSLFVGRLAFDCRTRELEELFGKYGRITRCDIKRGFAFIEFEDERDASDAIKYLDGTKFLGLNITVERTKGERRATTNPDGSRSRECFKCGRVGHYARECRSGGGSDRRGGVDRYERRDRYDRRGGDRRDYDRRDRYERRSRSRSPMGYGRSTRDDEHPRRRDSRSRSPKRSPANRY